MSFEYVRSMRQMRGTNNEHLSGVVILLSRKY